MSQPVKSCATCPARLDPGVALQRFGKSYGGVQVCATFGKPLSLPSATAEEAAKTQELLAKNCSGYGVPPVAPVDWGNFKPVVTMPDLDVLRFNRREAQDTVVSCTLCEHFIPDAVVAREHGIPTGLCAAKGKLLLSTRYTYEARNCEDRSQVTAAGVRRTTAGLAFLPEYNHSMTPSANPIQAHAEGVLNFVDPIDYPTDAPVEPDDAAAGIRAWRHITDPTTGNVTRLPIFSLDHFTAEEQTKIPRTGDDEHPEDYVDHAFYTYKVAVLWRELDETPAAWGRAGVGKTEFGRYMAWLMCLPFERVSITGSTQVDEIEGSMHFDPAKGTYWRDGRVTQAWSKPCVMVLDEPNVGQADVLQFTRPMMDNSKQLVVNDEMRDRNDHCYLMVAMNPAWDPINVGAHEISDADANRMMHITFELPPEELERDILATACGHDGYQIGPDLLETIRKIAADIRALADDDTLPISWGIRPQLKVARASRWFPLLDCYRMSVADFLEPAQREQVLDVVRTHVPK